MFGYDWPRLHAALNDLPAALLLVAVLFDLAGRGHPAARAPDGRVLDAGGGRGRRGAGGGLGPAGGGAHRPRGSGAPASWRPTRSSPSSPWASSRCWRSGGSCGSGGWEARERARGAGGLARRPRGTARDGGVRRQAGLRARGRHPDRGARRPRCTSGRRAITTTAARARPTSTAPTSTRRRPRAPIRPAAGPAATAADSGQPAGHTHAPGTPPHKD